MTQVITVTPVGGVATMGPGFYNVASYGASPGGTGNQTPYFAAAVAAMPTTGGTLYVGPGNYPLYQWAITKPIKVVGPGAVLTNFSASTDGSNYIVGIQSNGVSLEIGIEGDVSVGAQPAPDACILISTNAGVAYTDVRIQGCTIVGGRYGINSTLMQDSWITDNHIYGQWDYGIVGLTSCSRVFINDNVIRDVYRNSGVRIGALSLTPAVNDLDICGNIVTNCGIAGDQDGLDISTANGSRVRLDGNTISECPGAIEIKVFTAGTAYTDISICNNICTSSANTATGCDIACNFVGDLQDHLKRVLIQGNQLSTLRAPGGTFGIIVQSSFADLSILDNTIHGPSYCIRIDMASAFNLTRPVIRGNVINGGYGLYVTGSASETIVSGVIADNDITYLYNAIYSPTGGPLWTTPEIVDNRFRRLVTNGSGGPAMRLTGIQGGVIADNKVKCFGSALSIETGLTNTSVVVTGNKFDTSDATNGDDCIDITAATGTIEIYGNSLRPRATFGRGWVQPSGAATVLAGSNDRGVSAAQPTVAGSLGDVFYDSTPGAGATYWICTVAGDSGAATWTAQ